jgi:hypothetical protein
MLKLALRFVIKYYLFGAFGRDFVRPSHYIYRGLGAMHMGLMRGAHEHEEKKVVGDLRGAHEQTRKRRMGGFARGLEL